MINKYLEKLASRMEEKPDTIEMDVPTFIRTLEAAREDIKSDEELHKVVTKVIEVQKEKKEQPIQMSDYNKFFVRQKLRGM